MKRDVHRQRPARTVRSTTKFDSLPATRSVSLTIAGQRLSIRSDKDEDYLQHLASYLDDMIGELQRGTRNATTHQVLLLTALTLADELFQAQDRAEDLKEEVQRRTERLIRVLDDTVGAEEP